MKKQENSKGLSKYFLVLVAIVAIVAIVSLFKLGGSSGNIRTSSTGLFSSAEDLTGNAIYFAGKFYLIKPNTDTTLYSKDTISCAGPASINEDSVLKKSGVNIVRNINKKNVPVKLPSKCYGTKQPNTLLYYYCDKNFAHIVHLDCKNGCKDGACVSTSVACYEKINPATGEKMITAAVGELFTQTIKKGGSFCWGSTDLYNPFLDQLQTYISCDNNILKNITVSCPNGCKDDACIAPPKEIEQPLCTGSTGTCTKDKYGNTVYNSVAKLFDTNNKCIEKSYTNTCLFGWQTTNNKEICKDNIGCCKPQLLTVICNGNILTNTSQNPCTGEKFSNTVNCNNYNYYDLPMKCSTKTYIDSLTGESKPIVCEAVCNNAEEKITCQTYDNLKWYYYKFVCGQHYESKDAVSWNSANGIAPIACPTGTACVIKKENGNFKSGICA